MVDTAHISWNELRSQIQGDIADDLLTRAIYATDASNYQITPLAVITPKCASDLSYILDFAYKNKISITSRGAGTSLVGQTIGEGIILDFTKYMNQLLDVNPAEKYAWVEPGIVRDELNQSLSEHRLHFAPDPATSSRATVGGMIANNSSGTRSILYGKTIDHVIELEIMLITGETILCKNLQHSELEDKCQLQNREGEIYRSLVSIVTNNEEEIVTHFPKVMRRVGGYNLDEFLGGEFNLCKIICGSESTLGIITKAKINLETLPKNQAICAVHYHDFFECLKQVEKIIKFSPASVELLDEMLIQLSRENMETKRYCQFIEGDPQAVLLVEFFGESEGEAEQKAKDFREFLIQQNNAYAFPIYTDRNELESIFTLRKKGLGLLLGVKGKRKPIAIIEDAAVPLEHLADYIKEVFAVCKSNDTPVVAYAHASVGLLHVKPLLDLRDAEDIERMKKIAQSTIELVKKYKGSWSGEHGDGLARSPYNEYFFGKKLYKAFQEIKYVFDPLWLLNPGKIIQAPPVDQNLRYGAIYKDKLFKSQFHYRKEGGFHDAVHLCNGVGECRKTSGGTMCPSFRATKNEKDSTRARANILRMAMSGQLGIKEINEAEVVEAMELCLSCKACKSECPSNVDMSKLKAEVLFLDNKSKSFNPQNFLIKHQRRIAEMAIHTPGMNELLSRKWLRKLIEKFSGLDSKRILPKYNSKKFDFRNTNQQNKKLKKVVLYADTYILYHQSRLGEQAIKLLQYLGYDPEVYSAGCCQRPAMSKGMLDIAKREGKKVLDDLLIFTQNNIPIVMIEPSCMSAIVDDLPDLMEDNKYLSISCNTFLLEEFLVKEGVENIPIPSGDYLFHGHCHHKALFTTKAIHQLFSHVEIREIDSGCCGMAGSFGYQKKNSEISYQIGELSVFPPIRKSHMNTVILTSGFSCKHQIEDFTGRKAFHWLEILQI